MTVEENQEIASTLSETSPLQKDIPELLIDKVASLDEYHSTSDDDIQIEDLGDVSDSDIEECRTKNPKSVKVMLHRMVRSGSQKHTQVKVIL